MTADKTALCLAAILLLWNGAVFVLYAADKRRAKKQAWRVSEKTLLTCSFLLGGAGALAGMLFLRHKTRHLKFRILVPLSFLLTVFLCVCLFTAIWGSAPFPAMPFTRTAPAPAPGYYSDAL